MSRTNDYERRSTYSGPSTGRRDTHLQIRPEHESRLTDDPAPRLGALNIPCPTSPSLVPGRNVRGYALPHQHRRPRCCLEHIVHTLHETVNTHPSRSLQSGAYLNLERRALLVRPRADRVRDTLCLRRRHERPWRNVCAYISCMHTRCRIAMRAQNE